MAERKAGRARCVAPGIGRRLDLYLLGGLNDEVRARFEEHIFVCRACVDRLQLRQLVMVVLRTKAEPSSHSRERHGRRVRRDRTAQLRRRRGRPK